MNVLPRTEFGNPILRKKAKTLTKKEIQSKKIKDLAKQMIYTMRRVQGVGLAAPQVGESVQLAVMEMRKTKTRSVDELKGPIVIINPKIISYSKKKIPGYEGCLSCMSIRGEVPRSESIEVEYINLEGEKIKEKASGLWARIFQHEIDHLNGIVYVDRIEDTKTIMTQKEFEKHFVKKK
ncbi:MAG: peptide deformylase [Patescibacteria group bacterium UBA2103]